MKVAASDLGVGGLKISIGAYEKGINLLLI